MKAREKAFTLLELIFVLLLIGLMTSMVIPKVSSLVGLNLRSIAAHLSGYLRTAYEYSVMRHERIRIRFDIAQGTYWVETYDESPAIPLVDENVKIDDVMEKFEKREDEMNSMESDEKKAREDKRFKLVETSLLKKGSLPGAVRFKGVYTSGEGKTVTGGAPWVDIQPGGFVPKTIVYLGTDDEHVYSIILEPLGGRSRVEKGEVRPDET